jgi:hypothetical protein
MKKLYFSDLAKIKKFTRAAKASNRCNLQKNAVFRVIIITLSMNLFWILGKVEV